VEKCDLKWVLATSVVTELTRQRACHISVRRSFVLSRCLHSASSANKWTYGARA
jgi:hypothetical protein